ncbi:hypothetical protein ACFYL6_20590 [Micromonospora sp. NPDC007208]|uniref:hypothetical protein n=1 Tax=Micromonospora sp. NPDC007208 TaxID=3364236 RepID=UPI0036829586
MQEAEEQLKNSIRLLAGAALTVGALSLATPAMAVTWASASSPAYASEDGVAQAAGYGDFTNTGTNARSRSWQKDMKTGGQSVYVATSFSFYYTTCNPNCVTGFNSHGGDETNHTTSGSWSDQSIYWPLASQGEKARGSVKVCEDHTLAGDPCSGTYLPTFDY